MLDNTVNITRDYRGGRSSVVCIAGIHSPSSRGGKRAETGHAIHYHPVCVMTALRLRLDSDWPGQCTLTMAGDNM